MTNGYLCQFGAMNDTFQKIWRSDYKTPLKHPNTFLTPKNSLLCPLKPTWTTLTPPFLKPPSGSALDHLVYIHKFSTIINACLDAWRGQLKSPYFENFSLALWMMLIWNLKFQASTIVPKNPFLPVHSWALVRKGLKNMSFYPHFVDNRSPPAYPRWRIL